MTDLDDPTEEQVAAFEEQLEDLSEKDLLIGILAELKWLRVALTSRNRDYDGIYQAGDADPVAYQCRTCGTVVPEGEREKHLRDQHNAPPGIDVAEEYVKV